MPRPLRALLARWRRWRACRRPNAPFWRRKTLQEMTAREWEALCDGCGQCCLRKLNHPFVPFRTRHTRVACNLLDPDTCRCRAYENRFSRESDCVRITPAVVREFPGWLPETCAYLRVDQGRDLPDWHPLKTGDPTSVHAAGVSIRGRTVAESEAGRLADHVVRKKDLTS